MMDRVFRLGSVRVNLDELGSFVWSRCDGRRTAAEIAEELRQELGAGVEPAEQRLEQFLRRLLQSGLITVDGPQVRGGD